MVAQDGSRKGREIQLARMLRQIVKVLRRRSPASSEETAYRRLAKGGYAPRSIIDVGAYEGHWTRAVRSVFPDVPVLMVEAQERKSAILHRCAEQFAGVSVEICALANQTGRRVTFYEMETGSSFMPERSDVARKAVTLVTRTLDEITAHLPNPIFLKMDVQGAELDVLRGGLATLQRCDLVQLEVAFLPYNEGAPSLLETVSFMDHHGFVPLDITNLTRPDGTNLAQADFLFCPPTSPLRPRFFRFGP